MLRPFVNYLRQERPHAILAAMWPLTAICIVANLLAGSKARVVVSDHNMLSNEYAGFGLINSLAMRTSIAVTYRLADARVAVARGTANDVARLGWLAPAAMQVIYNPLRLVDGEGGDPAQADAAWGTSTGKRILTVGRLKTQKNHAMLLRAFKRLRETMDARLVILGVGECEAVTRQAIIDLGLEDCTILAGFADDPVPFYQSADLFVLSSDYEGFGNVIVEALACGTPVVSTDCPAGPAEILDHGRYGRLTPVGDADALARTMSEALAEKPDRDALKRRAREFDLETTARAYLGLLFPADAKAKGTT